MENRLRALLLPLGLVVGVGAALFGRSLGFDFNHHDDHPLLVQNHSFFADASNLPATVSEDVFALLAPRARGVYYRPVLLVSYMLDAQVAGTSPLVYRATNVALHLVASCLVFLFLHVLGLGRGRALLLALVFCVHPALVLIPAWIPCRNESLLAIFVLGSVLALVGYLRRGRRVWLALFLGGVGLSLFTKESAVPLLGVAPLVALHERRGRPRETRDLLAVGLMAFALLVLFLLLRSHVLGGFRIGTSRALDNLPALLVYLGKTLLPVGLSPLPTPEDSSPVPGIAAAALLAGLVWATGRRLWGLPALGLAWYAAFLLPVLVAPRETWGIENRLYVPMVGMLLFLGSALPSQLPARSARAATAAGVAVTAVFAIQSARRLPEFRDGLSYWESAVRRSPHSKVAMKGVAGLYLEHGRFEEAEQWADRGLAAWPERSELHLLRGVLYARRGDLDRAARHLRKSLDLEPTNTGAWMALQDVERRQRAAGARSADPPR